MMGQAAGLLEKLVEEHPREAAYRMELIRTYYLSGLLHTSCREPEQARRAFARAAELYRAAAGPGAPAAILNACAWFLADCPDASLRDPERAVALAGRAVEEAPEEARYWNTLGVARYRAGALRPAVAGLRRSQSLGGCGAYDWFFLAMAHARLGEKPQARAWYEKATAWLERQPAQNEELLRYRAEAEALLRD